MREIKFQAFVKPISIFANRQVGFMIDVSEIDFDERYVVDDDGGVYYFDEIELVQYTGLKDKNGVEIYEGDIVQMLERTINGAEFIHICQVFQHESGLWRMEGTCASSGIKLPKTNMGLHSNQKRVEVIGNIYENPELLKEVPQ